MKKVKTGLVAAAALATIGTGGLLGMQAVHAESSTTTDPMSSLVEKLANKFNLNKNDVQKVFDENRSEMEAKHEANVSTRLQKLVDAGTITSDQKTKVEAKLKELKSARETDRDALKNLSPEERKAKMEEKRNELDTWAKENGIDLTKLEGIFRGGHGFHGERFNHKESGDSN